MDPFALKRSQCLIASLLCLVSLPYHPAVMVPGARLSTGVSVFYDERFPALARFAIGHGIVEFGEQLSSLRRNLLGDLHLLVVGHEYPVSESNARLQVEGLKFYR